MPPVTAKPPTPIGDSTSRFVGRAQQIAQFRDSVRYALGTQNAPPDRHYTHIFIAYGEGGMGKSRLLERWCEVAREEQVPAERVIMVQLDQRVYPTVDALATVIRDAIAANFPAFDERYQAAQDRRAPLEERFDALQEEWHAYESLRDSGKLNEHRRVAKRNLAHTETQRAKAGTLSETVAMVNQAEDSLSRLRSIDRFTSATGKNPVTFAALLQHEFGADAALFENDSWHSTSFGADVCALAEAADASAQTLVLAIDTYELADQHDDWLREMLLQAGDHVLTLIGGRNDLAQRDGFQRRFADDLRTYVQTFDLGRETLNRSDIRQFLHLMLEREPTEAETDEVERISRGVPLAVQLLTSELSANRNLNAYHTLQTQTLNRNEVIRTVTRRFLSYISEQQDDHSELGEQRQRQRLQIQALALPYRSDEALMCALWDVNERDVVQVNRELRATHSFVFAGERAYTMHDLVREFVRADVWHEQPAGWLQLCARMERATTLLQQSLARWDAEPPEVRFDDPDWRAAVLNLLNLLLWRKEHRAARDVLLNTWIAARYYNQAMATELEKLIQELTPPTNEWRTLAKTLTTRLPSNQWHNQDQRDYAALKPYFAQWSSHVQMLWYVLQGQQVEPFLLWLDGDQAVQALNQAIAFHQQAYEMQPDWQPGRENLARLHSYLADYTGDNQKQWQQAVEQYITALEFAATDPAIFFGSSLCLR